LFSHRCWLCVDWSPGTWENKTKMKTSEDRFEWREMFFLPQSVQDFYRGSCTKKETALGVCRRSAFLEHTRLNKSVCVFKKIYR
jgi:hypothetical protein